jgi:hypothetical protein
VRCRGSARHPEGPSETQPVGVGARRAGDRMHEPADGVVHAQVSVGLLGDAVGHLRGPYSVVVDGRTLTWEEFGEALEPFEGWRFRLVIEDPGIDLRPDAAVIELP